MSRARASIGGGTSGLLREAQPSKRERQQRERQRLRGAKQQMEAPAPKRTLAERVLPWRRKKAKLRDEQRERVVAQIEGIEQHEAERAAGRRSHRRLWRGIHTMPERRRLHAIGQARILAHGDDLPQYDHPQRRRRERDVRNLARWQAQDEKYGSLEPRFDAAAP